MTIKEYLGAVSEFSKHVKKKRIRGRTAEKELDKFVQAEKVIQTESRRVKKAGRKPVRKPSKSYNASKPGEPFVGTISELGEKLCQSIKSWDPVEKAIFRASVTGRLSSDESDRIQ